MENKINSLMDLATCSDISSKLVAPEYLRKNDLKSSMEAYDKIKQAAYLDIPVHHSSPIFKVFAYRQELAYEILKNGISDIQLGNLKIQFEYLNNDIKKYLGL